MYIPIHIYMGILYTYTCINVYVPTCILYIYIHTHRDVYIYIYVNNNRLQTGARRIDAALYIYICRYIYVYMSIYNVNMFTYADRYNRSYLSAYIERHLSIRIHLCVSCRAASMYPHTSLCVMYTCLHADTDNRRLSTGANRIHKLTHTHIYIYTYTIYIYVYMSIYNDWLQSSARHMEGYTYILMYTYTHRHTHACIYIHIHIHNHRLQTSTRGIDGCSKPRGPLKILKKSAPYVLHIVNPVAS